MLKRLKLIELRENTGFTQEEIAFKAQIKRSSYGSIENGLRNPSLAVAQKIAKAYKVSLEEAFPNEIFFAGKCYDMKQKNK